MKTDSKIVVFGHTGLVGSAVMRRLVADGFTNIINASTRELDLRNQSDVNSYFDHERPKYVFICAGLVGGIFANNTRRAEFIYDNTMIQLNIIHAAHLYGVVKLVALGSACIYPRDSSDAIVEDRLLTGELEPTNEPYAVSKIVALKACDAYRYQYGCNFISLMPTNMYGVGDTYDPLKAHVLPALIRKFVVAKKKNEDVTMWGTGTPRREFMYSDDMADAAMFLMENYDEPGHINVGTGVDISIRELAEMIADAVGFSGEILHDYSKPDGMLKRKLDVSKINGMGWYAKTKLKDGIAATIKDIYLTGKHLSW